METLYLNETEADLKRAADIIRGGGLAAFPTETVYGLGGNAFDGSASERIYAAKGRPSDNPLIVHICDISQIDDVACNISDCARALARSIWPGPMTLVLQKRAAVPDATTGGLNTVAVRMPANDTALKLIAMSGAAVAAPSANLSGRPSPTMWEHVRDDLDGRIDAVIMGQPCACGIESTVIDMTADAPMILRPGLITPERVEGILGVSCRYDPAITKKPGEGIIPKAPGMKYKHYAPKAKMKLFSGQRDKVAAAMEKEASANPGARIIKLMYEDGTAAAQRLFADLRRADEDGADLILAMALSDTDSVNYSVMNRMLKSAGYDITEV